MSSQPSGSPATDLGAALAELGVVTDGQWAEAVSRAGGPDHLPVALDLLTRTPAAWAPADAPGGVRSTALCGHQVKQIDKCLKDAGGLAKLPRLLRWNDYFILEPIGKGGMGVVYKGWDVTNNRYVAIKRTHRDSPEVRKRLKREAKLQLYLDHPNIARLFSREKFGPSDLLVLEYLPGNTLSEVIHKRGKDKPMPWPFVAELAADLLDALDHAHGNNKRNVTVIHRDIKPGNVMLMRQKVGGTEKYIPKLLDMGLAKSVGGDAPAAGHQTVSVDEQLTRQFQILGTPEYMAPEQWEGGLAAVPESDVYCLGGTLYYALVGDTPFVGVNKGNKMTYFAEMCHKHASDPRPSVRARRPDVPVELDRLVQQMLAVAPSHRGKCLELRDRFRALLAAPRTGPVSGVVPRPGPGSRPAAKSPPPPPAEDAPSIYKFAVQDTGSKAAAGPASRPAPPPRPAAAPPPRPAAAPRPAPPARPADPDEDISVMDVPLAAGPASGKLTAGPPSARLRRPPAPVVAGLDDDEDDDTPTRKPSRSRDGGRLAVAGLFDPSAAGERTRLAAKMRVVEFFRGLARPDRHPVAFAAVLLPLLLVGWWSGSVMPAVFLLAVLALAVGFAFTVSLDGDR